MKKVIFLILVVLLIAISINVVADGDRKSGLFSYQLKGNGTAVITGFDWNANGGNDIYIPRMIDGYTVTEIGDYAFSSNNITSKIIGQSVVVVLPDTITIIGEKAFFCTAINTISIPASVQMIGPGAFAGCVNIKEHNVSNDNKVFTTIKGVLYNKQIKELVSVPASRNFDYVFEVPEGIKSIGDYAFYGITFTGVKYGCNPGISFPQSLTKIGEYAFSQIVLDPDYSSIRTLSWEDAYFNFNNVEEIGDHAFESAQTSIVGYNFSKVKKIGSYAFANIQVIGFHVIQQSMINKGCYNMMFPSSLKEMGEGAFYKYHSDRGDVCKIDLSKTALTEIPDYAFQECGVQLNNASFILPQRISRIGKYAFAKVGKQGNIYTEIIFTIPTSVETIDEYAFYLGSGKIIFSEGSKLRTIEDHGFYGTVIWNNVFDLPQGLKSIGEEALDCQKVRIISIPNSVTKIGNNVSDRTAIKLRVEAGSYAALYASENGYIVDGEEDTSWLNN